MAPTTHDHETSARNILGEQELRVAEGWRRVLSPWGVVAMPSFAAFGGEWTPTEQPDRDRLRTTDGELRPSG